MLTLGRADMRLLKEMVSWFGWRGSRGLSRRPDHKLPDVEIQIPFPEAFPILMLPDKLAVSNLSLKLETCNCFLVEFSHLCMQHLIVCGVSIC